MDENEKWKAIMCEEMDSSEKKPHMAPGGTSKGKEGCWLQVGLQTEERC